jgi:hypothetical protein
MTPLIHFTRRQRPQHNGRVLFCVLHSSYPRGLLFPSPAPTWAALRARVEPDPGAKKRNTTTWAPPAHHFGAVSLNTIVLPSRKQSTN